MNATRFCIPKKRAVATITQEKQLLSVEVEVSKVELLEVVVVKVLVLI